MEVKVIAGLTVHEVPDYAAQSRYWVVSLFDNEPWFFGAYDKKDIAKAQSALAENPARFIIDIKAQETEDNE